MSEPAQEQTPRPDAPKKSRFWIKVNLGILFGLAGLNSFLMLYIVPKFEEIYQDALPGKPLPSATEFILSDRHAIAILVWLWPILCTVLGRQQKSYAIYLINLGILWYFLQIGITFHALIMPMVATETGMSDHSP